MLHILANRHRDTLADFAASNVLLAFDFDGTLAPIVPDPDAALMRPSTRRLLAAVARRYPCIVIAGRARRDLTRRLGPVPVFHVAGNHGLEPWAQDKAYPARIQSWVGRLEASLAAYRGVTIENKTYSVTVHYRRARPRQRAVAAIRRAVRDLSGVRALDGECSVNLVPSGAPSKGAALERARRLVACETAIYVGDDQTDEDVFASAGRDRLLAIRVAACRASRAGYHLRNQAEIDDLLRALVAFRPIRRGVKR